jgi:hypothetical protein
VVTSFYQTKLPSQEDLLANSNKIKMNTIAAYTSSDKLICSLQPDFNRDVENKLSTLAKSCQFESNTSLEDNKEIEFHFSNPIDLNDLDVVILFLENSKKSGGGDIEKYQLDNTKQVLEVLYKSKNVRKRVLERHNLNFMSYNIEVMEPFHFNQLETDNCILILKNLGSDLDEDIIKLYAENLIDNDLSESEQNENQRNDIESLSHSKIFADTHYIKYKFNFNWDYVLSRYRRRPSLYGRQIQLLPAMKSHTVIVAPADKSVEIKELGILAMHFSNKKRSGVSSYRKIQERGSYVLLVLNNENDAKSVINRKHEIAKKEFIVEYMYNLELIDELLKGTKLEKITEESKDESKTNDKKLVQPNDIEKVSFKGGLIKKDKQTHNKAKDTKSDLSLASKQSNLILKQCDEPNISVLYYWDEICFKKFVSDLFNLAAFPIKHPDDKMQIDIEPTINLNELNLEEAESYWKKVIEYLSKFFLNFETKSVLVKNAEEALEKVSFDKDKVHLKLLPLKDDKKQSANNVQFVEVCGLVQYVNETLIELEVFNRKEEQKENELINDTMTGLKLYETRILYVNKFIKNMKDKYNSVIVTLNPKSGVMQLENGTRAEIKDIKKNVKELLSLITKIDYPVSEEILKFIELKEHAVVSWQRKQDLECALDFDTKKNFITIYSIKKDHIERFWKNFNESCTSHHINLGEILDTFNKVTKMDLIEFIEEQKQTSDSAIVYLSEDQEVIIICGFNESANKIYKNLLQSVRI